MVAWHRHCCDKLRRRRAVIPLMNVLALARLPMRFSSASADVSGYCSVCLAGAPICRAIVGIVVNGVATGLYIGARFGRVRAMIDDRTRSAGWLGRVVRTIIEAIVLISGFAKGFSRSWHRVVCCHGPIAHHNSVLRGSRPLRTKNRSRRHPLEYFGKIFATSQPHR